MTDWEAYEDLSFNMQWKVLCSYSHKMKYLWKTFIITESSSFILVGTFYSLGDFKSWFEIKFPEEKDKRRKDDFLIEKLQVNMKRRKDSYFSSNWHANEIDIVVFKKAYLLKVV